MLETQDQLLKFWLRPARSVGDEVSANVAIDVAESCIDVLLDDNDDWDFEGAGGLDEAQRAGVKRRFYALQ